jgi:NAD(P)-dependent dehydrogenase (short-subunit alcohol dehydrogenase family)
MKDKIALVTGANRSIGFEVVRALASLGMTVYLGSRNEERGRKAAAELAGEGDVQYIKLDVTDESTMVQAIKTIEQAHGRLDVLVNNAGITIGKTLDQITATNIALGDIRTIFETNVYGVVRLTQLAIPLLRKSNTARVVNVSSGAGSLAIISAPNSALGPIKPFAYCLSKVALNGVTALFAAELLADGIKVNSADPGLVNSDLSRHMGTRTGKDGARIIVKLATLGEDGPTGGFFSEKGPIPW